jgi:hypothetical protein
LSVIYEDGLDAGLTDGSRQRVERDLAADLDDAQPGVGLLQVNAFVLACSRAARKSCAARVSC